MLGQTRKGEEDTEGSDEGGSEGGDSVGSSTPVRVEVVWWSSR